MSSDNGFGPWLTKREAAEYLGVSDTWLSERMERERRRPGSGIRYVKYGTSRRSIVRFHIDDLDAFAEAHRPAPPVRKRRRQRVG